ncbi:MAG: TrbI/VirB10 family protein, partial [Candidatus Tectimicrobiota bacterium]
PPVLSRKLEEKREHCWRGGQARGEGISLMMHGRKGCCGGVCSNINRAGQQIVGRQLQQPPTIEIRPGFAVNVFVNADLVLQPYQAPGRTPH